MPLIEDLGGVSFQAQQQKASARTATMRGKRAVPGAPGARHPTADSATKLRAQVRRLAELERENYQDNVKIDIPRLDLRPGAQPPKGMTINSRRILGSKKTLNNHLDDDPKGAKSYQDVVTPPSVYPAREPLCSICGYWGRVSCIRCGAKYCSIPCEAVHRETRCLKVYG
uniref:ARAD1D46772p n=1 Tax=Blastobotrys adeninivorans TaxID=409370 RepID=A0A060TII4_BLAAD